MSAICKRLFAAALLMCLLCGCSHEERFSITWLDLFDTVCSFTAYSESREAFEALAEEIHAELLQLHRLCDAYNEYEGLVNLCTLNRCAALSPQSVDADLYTLLEASVSLCKRSSGKLNLCMGSVLLLWHEAREGGTALPDQAALERAAQHCSCASLRLQRGSVYYEDPDLQLDLGAFAKGYAAARIYERYEGSWLLNLGGTVAAKGAKPDGSAWQVAVSNAFDGGSLGTISLRNRVCATSSDNQRYFEVDGVRYSHIIDPDTLYPADRYRQVTVICEDGFLADALSTALFLLPQEDGKQLAAACGAQALWVLPDGSLVKSSDFPAL